MFRKIRFFLLLSVLVLFSAVNGQATHPYGSIDDTLDYQMQLERDRDGHCYLKGRINNRKYEDRENLRITIYAVTIHRKVLWKHKLYIDELRAEGSYPFHERIRQCTDEDPYAWEFRIKECVIQKKR